MYSVFKCITIPLTIDFPIIFFSIKPEPIFIAEGGASTCDRYTEGIIIGAGGYFGLEIDSPTRDLINGLVGYGNKDVS
jgi:hypothetical protein